LYLRNGVNKTRNFNGYSCIFKVAEFNEHSSDVARLTAEPEKATATEKRKQFNLSNDKSLNQDYDCDSCVFEVVHVNGCSGDAVLRTTESEIVMATEVPGVVQVLFPVGGLPHSVVIVQ
jgi:hypothetical protein